MPSLADVAARVLPAVIAISTERVLSASDAPTRSFFGVPGKVDGAGVLPTTSMTTAMSTITVTVP